MKRRNPCTLSVRINNQTSYPIEKIEFIFKPYLTENVLTDSTVKKVYTSSGSSEVTLGDNDGLYIVPFTAEDTLKFEPGQTLYMDTRIKMIDKENGNKAIYPETGVVPLTMNGTLFEDNPGEGG